MMAEESAVDWTVLAEEPERSPGLEGWLAAHPEEAAELALARRVHLLLEALRAFPVTTPPDFEARLLQRCRQNTTVLQLLDLWLTRGSQALVELLEVIFALLPEMRPSAGATTATRR